MSKQIKKISCVNSAAFVMNFEVISFNEGEKVLAKTDNFPVGQERTIDLSEYNLPEGTPVWIKVKAILGKSQGISQHSYISSAVDYTQAFRVTGTTLNYKIKAL